MAHASPLRPLIAGNWKMNGSVAALAEALAVRDRLAEPDFAAGVDVMLCPPAPLLPLLAGELARGRLQLGAQDCHAAPSGAHTGDLSAELLKDVGASAVIVGHSERRAEHGESDQEVRRKVSAAHRAGLTAIVCLGETAGERRAGLTLDVIGRQLARSLPEHVRAADTVIAYEPVWAIGSGLSAKPEDVAEVHGFLRQALTQRCGEEGARLRLLYGGSVKPDNAEQLLAIADVNGALVGGASLKAADFLGIVAACGA
ncbi:MAG TPA: triose-phosphate isomerase [Hyphomicrobiaceae bacterium]|jgi:triosephosphate isomerase|nr:triose-phosphate isomerase [Hyphomicrobiaceae bacterium]